MQGTHREVWADGMVWYKELKSKTEAQNKLESQWQEGIWLGHTRDSNEALIGNKEES